MRLHQWAAQHGIHDHLACDLEPDSSSPAAHDGPDVGRSEKASPSTAGGYESVDLDQQSAVLDHVGQGGPGRLLGQDSVDLARAFFLILVAAGM